MRFDILGKSWKIKILSKSQYKKKHGSDSDAVTYLNKRKIELSPNGRSKETIVHELVHAYMAELCTHSADLDDDSIEEIFAELMSKFGFQLLTLADDLFWKLSNGKNS